VLQPIDSNISSIPKAHKSSHKPLSIVIDLFAKELKNYWILSPWYEVGSFAFLLHDSTFL